MRTALTIATLLACYLVAGYLDYEDAIAQEAESARRAAVMARMGMPR